MQGVGNGAEAGSFRVFVSERGQHRPELMAEMSLHQLIDNDSHPLKRAEIRQSLIELYAQVQRMARIIFKITEGDDLLNRAVIEILAKDYTTALDIERQFHKETR